MKLKKYYSIHNSFFIGTLVLPQPSPSEEKIEVIPDYSKFKRTKWQKI